MWKTIWTSWCEMAGAVFEMANRGAVVTPHFPSWYTTYELFPWKILIFSQVFFVLFTTFLYLSTYFSEIEGISDGWWLCVDRNGRKGLAPANRLQVMHRFDKGVSPCWLVRYTTRGLLCAGGWTQPRRCSLPHCYLITVCRGIALRSCLTCRSSCTY